MRPKYSCARGHTLARKRTHSRAKATAYKNPSNKWTQEHLFFRLSGRLYRAYPSIAIERRARCGLLSALVATDRFRHSNGLACFWFAALRLNNRLRNLLIPA